MIAGTKGRETSVVGGARSIEVLVRALQGLVDRPVVDRTGLTGTYDFELRFAAAPLETQATGDTDVPSTFAAVQEQLGLRLEPARALIEFLVVDRINRPTPN